MADAILEGMTLTGGVLFAGDTGFEHYEVVDTIYEGRPARVIYSGNRIAAQSGIARDDNPELLFDYNQRFFELITGLGPKRLLVIGGGVYTLPMAVLQAFPDTQVDVVELDSALDDIATEFFGLKPDPRLRIIHQEGREFLDANDTPYDLIVIDAFINVDVPRSLTTPEAAQQYYRNLTRNGVVAMNIISAYHGRNEIVRHQYEAFAAAFRQVEVYPAGKGYALALPQNLVVVGRKGRRGAIGSYLRYPALPPLGPS